MVCFKEVCFSINDKLFIVFLDSYFNYEFLARFYVKHYEKKKKNQKLTFLPLLSFKYFISVLKYTFMDILFRKVNIQVIRIFTILILLSAFLENIVKIHICFCIKSGNTIDYNDNTNKKTSINSLLNNLKLAIGVHYYSNHRINS